MATLEKIEKDIIRTKAKISEYQQKLRNLDKRRKFRSREFADCKSR